VAGRSGGAARLGPDPKRFREPSGSESVVRTPRRAGQGAGLRGGRRAGYGAAARVCEHSAKAPLNGVQSQYAVSDVSRTGATGAPWTSSARRLNGRIVSGTARVAGFGSRDDEGTGAGQRIRPTVRGAGRADQRPGAGAGGAARQAPG